MTVSTAVVCFGGFTQVKCYPVFSDVASTLIRRAMCSAEFQYELPATNFEFTSLVPTMHCG